MWTTLLGWLQTHKSHVAMLAMACFFLIFFVGDSCRARSMANDYLKLARGWHAKFKADEAAWKKMDQAFKADNAKRKAAMTKARTGKPWEAPKDAEETAARFRAAGYGATAK